MRARREDLLAGALGLAYKYCSLGDLRRGYAALEGKGEQNGFDLPQALLDAQVVPEPWAHKLRRGADLALCGFRKFRRRHQPPSRCQKVSETASTWPLCGFRKLVR